MLGVADAADDRFTLEYHRVAAVTTQVDRETDALRVPTVVNGDCLPFDGGGADYEEISLPSEIVSPKAGRRHGWSLVSMVGHGSQSGRWFQRHRPIALTECLALDPRHRVSPCLGAVAIEGERALSRHGAALMCSSASES